MFDDDEFVWQLASQRAQIDKNLKLIHHMVALKKKEVLGGSGDDDDDDDTVSVPLKQQLSTYKNQLIKLAKDNQDRFDRLAMSKGVLDSDRVELEIQQDIMRGRRAITGERLNDDV